MWFRSLGQDDHLGEEMATYSSILARRILWMTQLNVWACMHGSAYNPEKLISLGLGHFGLSQTYGTQLCLDSGFPCGSAGKESTCNAGDLDSIPELGSSPGKGEGNPLQYSGLGNYVDCIVHGAAKSQTRLSDFCFTLSWFTLNKPT